MKVIDYKETMKCLEEVEDCEDKTYAKSLLEWAINKRTFEAVPLSVIEDIKAEIDKEIYECVEQQTQGSYLIATGLDNAKEIIDKAVKECTHEL